MILIYILTVFSLAEYIKDCSTYLSLSIYPFPICKKKSHKPNEVLLKSAFSYKPSTQDENKTTQLNFKFVRNRQSKTSFYKSILKDFLEVSCFKKKYLL